MNAKRKPETWTERFLSLIRWDGFPNCCQASILSGFLDGDNSPLSPTELASIKVAVIGDGGYIRTAITAQYQEKAEYVLENIGFTKAGSYDARTGNRLTVWIFIPEDQECDDEDGYNEEDDYDY